MDITPTVVQAFRDYYPEFADTTTWPDATLTRSLEAADDETGSKRWGNYIESPASFKARGLFAYAAHRAVLSKAAQRAVENGGTPAPAAQASSKQVGDESVQYAVPMAESMAEAQGIGDLRATIYGQEFLRLRRRAGAGMASTGQVRL